MRRTTIRQINMRKGGQLFLPLSYGDVPGLIGLYGSAFEKVGAQHAEVAKGQSPDFIVGAVKGLAASQSRTRSCPANPSPAKPSTCASGSL